MICPCHKTTFTDAATFRAHLLQMRGEINKAIDDPARAALVAAGLREAKKTVSAKDPKPVDDKKPK